MTTGPMFFGNHPFPARVIEQFRYAPDAHFPLGRKASLEHWLGLPGSARLQPSSFHDWVAPLQAFDTTPRLMLTHMPILAGTDVGVTPSMPQPGFALHDHLVFYVARGMTFLQALRAATLNPALVLHATDSLGTIAVGKLADLVLLDADPLRDIWNTTKIRAVVADGRYYDRAALDQLQAQAERAARQ